MPITWWNIELHVITAGQTGTNPLGESFRFRVDVYCNIKHFSLSNLHQLSLRFCLLEVYPPKHIFAGMGTVVLDKSFSNPGIFPVALFVIVFQEKPAFIAEYLWLDNDDTG